MQIVPGSLTDMGEKLVISAINGRIVQGNNSRAGRQPRGVKNITVKNPTLLAGLALSNIASFILSISAGYWKVMRVMVAKSQPWEAGSPVSLLSHFLNVGRFFREFFRRTDVANTLASPRSTPREGQT